MKENSETYTTVHAEYLRKLGVGVLEKVGIPIDDAEITIASLVETDLRGVHSHGMMRLTGYVDRLLQEGTNPKPDVRVVTETGGTAVIDGDNGLGQVVSKRAMEVAIDKSRASGIGVAGARNSSHFGACAHWAQMALPHDMIGIATTNGGPIMAPWGGLTPTMGNDPLGVAIPAGEELPIVLDMATSVVAGGKLDLAIRKGEKIPKGWALNSQGEPTEDPVEARAGLVLPIGEYKGYALTLVFEVLAAVLMGANFARQVVRHEKLKVARNVGHYFQAINIAAFMPVAEFKSRVDNLIQQMKSAELAPGYDRIYLPGEPEHEKRARYLNEGIPMLSSVIADLGALADKFGVDQSDSV